MRAPRKLSAPALCGGVFVPILTPFSRNADVLFEDVKEQVEQFAEVSGVRGVVLNSLPGKRLTLTHAEQVEVARCAKRGLKPDQLLLVKVDLSADDLLEFAEGCQSAQVDAIIYCPTAMSKCSTKRSSNDEFEGFLRTANRLPLPALISAPAHWSGLCEQLSNLVLNNDFMLGFEFGADNDVARYDRIYYQAKSMDRPVTCLASSDSALFHKLNTGCDGAVSRFATIAPMEITALFGRATNSSFLEAQSMHNKLAPLHALFGEIEPSIQEGLHRVAAYYRGFLRSPFQRGHVKVVDSEQRCRLHDAIDFVRLSSLSLVGQVSGSLGLRHQRDASRPCALTNVRRWNIAFCG